MGAIIHSYARARLQMSIFTRRLRFTKGSRRWSITVSRFSRSRVPHRRWRWMDGSMAAAVNCRRQCCTVSLESLGACRLKE